MYEGLPIITNKIPDDERKGIPHHLLGCIGLQEPTWTVGDYARKASKIIGEIRSKRRLPILVGGTHYYTQATVFKQSILDEEDSGEEDKTPEEADNIWPILQGPTEDMLVKLHEVDPVIAERWHPKDRRKIRRSLEIWLKTGRRASDVYDEQKRQVQSLRGTAEAGNEEHLDDSSSSGLQLRYPTLILWVHAESEGLKERLDRRTEVMFEQGLVEEASAMHGLELAQGQQGRPVDRTRGIWVSIGYKELYSYLEALRAGGLSEKELEKLKAEAVARVQAATRQYSKRQVRWIRIKLPTFLGEDCFSKQLYLLDGSDLAQWEEKVSKPAMDLTTAFLEGDQLSPPKQLSEEAKSVLESIDPSINESKKISRRTCELCGTTVMTAKEWTLHEKSQGHRRAIRATERTNGPWERKKKKKKKSSCADQVDSDNGVPVDS